MASFPPNPRSALINWSESVVNLSMGSLTGDFAMPLVALSHLQHSPVIAMSRRDVVAVVSLQIRTNFFLGIANREHSLVLAR